MTPVLKAVPRVLAPVLRTVPRPTKPMHGDDPAILDFLTEPLTPLENELSV